MSPAPSPAHAPSPPLGSRRERWGHAFGLARIYWTSKDWKAAWAITVLLVALQFGVAWIFVLGNRWQRSFFDAVENRQAALLAPLVLAFLGIMLLQVGYSLASSYFQLVIGNRWRAVLTRHYLDRWMARDRYAEIERLRIIDNPDQRIAEDIAELTGTRGTRGGGALALVLGLIGTVAGAVSMIAILLETAEPIRLSLAGHAVAIPGSTVWYAALYAVFGSYVMVWIGRPFVRATMRQQHREADFRADMIHVRRHAAQIGFARAVPAERAALAQSFDEVRRNFRTVIYSLMGIQTGQGIYERIGSMLPLFLMVPRYFAGAISFGQVMGARDAFQTLVGHLSYLVTMYSQIGTQIACVNRLKALDDAIDRERPRGIRFMVGTPPGVALATRGLHLARPDGGTLLTVDDWQVRDGERWVVRGPSGAGKSTLLRALAGLWPDGGGTVTMTGEGLVMLVPQRMYLPLGTLKGAICFPDAPDAHADAAIAALLRRVRLDDHVARMHEARQWQDELSPGEQQRLALARILLHRPTMLVIDEATSALDPDNAAYFHNELLGAMPGLTLVSVVHDDRLDRFHTHRLTIADDGGTARATAETVA